MFSSSPFDLVLSKVQQQEYMVIPISSDVLDQARDLVAKHPLRTLDAIQLASALFSAQALGEIPVFVTADQRLLEVASVESFTVDDPEAYP